MKKVAIIGFGRFGQLLGDLVRSEFEVQVVETNVGLQTAARHAGFDVISLQDVAQADFIFLAVPISSIKGVIKEVAPLLHENNLVIDICSVKVYPANLMKQHLAHCQTIATHPLFGPDSASKGLDGLKMLLSRLNVSDENYSLWKDFWIRKGLTVIEATPEEHDKDSVYSQAFTYSIARVILEMGIPPLRFTTRSYNDIKEIAELSAKDSEQLFHDMLFYNPYFSDMKQELEESMNEVLRRLNKIETEQRVKQPSLAIIEV